MEALPVGLTGVGGNAAIFAVPELLAEGVTGWTASGFGGNDSLLVVGAARVSTTGLLVCIGPGDGAAVGPFDDGGGPQTTCPFSTAQLLIRAPPPACGGSGWGGLGGLTGAFDGPADLPCGP